MFINFLVSWFLGRKKKKGLPGLQKEQRKLKSNAEVRIFDIISTFLFFTFLPGYGIFSWLLAIFINFLVSWFLGRKKKKGLAGLQKEQRKLKSDSEVRIFDIISTFLFFTFLPGYGVFSWFLGMFINFLVSWFLGRKKKEGLTERKKSKEN